jgi:aminoglycoside phosphotransferase (APT) family kinase protein
MSQAELTRQVRGMQAALLRSIRSDLDLVVAPAVGTEQGRMALALASEMLAWLEMGAVDSPRITAPATERMVRLLGRADALCRQAGIDEAEIPEQPVVASELHDDPEFAGVQSALGARLAALLASSAGGSGLRREIGRLASDAVAAENAVAQAEYESLRARHADRPDPVAAVECDITPQCLQAWAEARLADRDPGVIEHLERVPGGYSKDTWRLRFSRGIDGHRALILRRDLPFGPGENTVTEEVALLGALADAGLEVPRPLCVEPDAAYLGKPFLLFPQLPGKAVFGDWHAGPDERRTVILEVARLMARLHAIDPFSTGVVDPSLASRVPQEIVRDTMRLWRDKWLRRRSHPSIILETAFDWLIRNAPASLPRVSFVHSDISFRNTLIEDGHLCALLDWEFWHLGDPMEDLGYFRLVAEPFLDWDTVMAAYQEAGGEPYHPERAAFYEVWRSVRNGTTTTTAWWGFLNGAYPASKAAYQGVSLYRLFLRDVAQQLGRVQL